MSTRAHLLLTTAFVPPAVLALAGCGSLAGDAQNGRAPGDASVPTDAPFARDASQPLDANAREASSESGVSPVCPAKVPDNGAACTPRAAPPTSDSPSELASWVCEYGSDPHCDTYAQCFAADGGSSWIVTPPDPSCAGNPPACPAAFDAGTSGECPTQGSCTYPEGLCSCTSCRAEDGAQGADWLCGTWQTPAGCPEPRPLLGSACATEGLSCAYGGSCCEVFDVGPAMLCTGGYWAVLETACACPANLCSE